MTREQAHQIARIICCVFEYEEKVDPRTVAKVFEYIGHFTNYTDEVIEDDE